MKLSRAFTITAAFALAAGHSPLARAEDPPMHAGALAHALDRLAHAGRVLYVAAHPDDENTRLLAYLANARHLTVAYLSVTRGGGGQNLIGSEQDELLGVIRTQELLAARRQDAAQQRFTRMRDFGYSKSAEETLQIWGHDEALADVVWVVRTFQPDVIITRFDEVPPNHGHHIASARLAREAFAAAADAKQFPEQLARGATVWKTDRLLLNVPFWREDGGVGAKYSLDVGEYDARLGLSYGELAARSRSMHKSQGFGASGERGPLLERFDPVAGTVPKSDIFEGLEFGLERYERVAAPLVAALANAKAALMPHAPERALPALLSAQEHAKRLPDDVRTRDLRRNLDRVIADSIGLFLRATSDRDGAVPGAKVPVTLEAVVRRPAQVELQKVEWPGGAAETAPVLLAVHEKKLVKAEVTIPASTPISAPYWLAVPSSRARHEVSDLRWVGDPEGPAPLVVRVQLSVSGRLVQLELPLEYVWTDRVHGERSRRFMVVPPATVTPVREAVLLPNGQSAAVALRVRAGQDAVNGEVRLPLPAGWRVEPATFPLKLAKSGDEVTASFRVTPPKGATAISVAPEAVVDGRSWSFRSDLIDYAHIPVQFVLQPAAVRLVPAALSVPKGRIGYVAGPGDTVAEDLAHVGAKMELIDDATLRAGDLSAYAAILVGIRAYNTRDALLGAHARLMSYVERGGVVVVQYNTHSRWSPLTASIGPLPLELGRGRVTDETAEMKILDPKNPLLRTPNVIGAADFDGWVQERGLYFGEKWDPKYETVFEVKDPDEAPQQGSLLVAKHGKGRYVYTGLAFFRQLPAGVPGAYRLLANLLAPVK